MEIIISNANIKPKISFRPVLLVGIQQIALAAIELHTEYPPGHGVEPWELSPQAAA